MSTSPSKLNQSSGGILNKSNPQASSGYAGSGTSKSKKPISNPPLEKSSPTSSAPASPLSADAHSQSPNPLLDVHNKEKTDNNLEDADESKETNIVSSEAKAEPERCAICMDDYTEPKKLDKCGHVFCTECIDQYFHAVKPQCPCCFTVYGEIRGNQPESGVMRHMTVKTRLPGFEKTSSGTIQINYSFPDGTQDEKHPKPGQPYYGTSRDAYLPDNKEGRNVLKLLKKSFELRQTFTIGQSRTTGCDDVVTWNDIHHKTSTHGGMANFGYPDKTYLNRVQQELAAKGIK